MADDFLTAADLLIVNDQNADSNLDISDVLDDAPLMSRLPAVEATGGNIHKFIKQVEAPLVGFRDINDGRDHDSSVDEAVTINLAILDASFSVDVAVADAYRGGTRALLEKEAKRHLRAAFRKADDTIVSGTSADFVGLTGAFSSWSTPATVMLSNKAAGAGGSDLTSVYSLKLGDNGCAVVLGAGGLEIGESQIQRVSGSASGHYMAWVTPIYCWIGLQVGSINTVGRICNISSGDDTTLTDAMVFEHLTKWQQSDPSILVMNRRSREQLRSSRTATNATGAFADMPTESAGIEIVVSESVLSNETDQA